MELTNDIKARICAAISADRGNYPSDARHATNLGISSSVYNAIKQGKIEKQLSEAMWLGIARRLGVALRPEAEWHAVQTETYVYVTAQLTACQYRSLSAILCDKPNIGKSFAARAYAKTHKHVAYVDCSQCKTKREMVRTMAREFGISTIGTYKDLYRDLIHYLQHIDNPLVILDEAGDLQYEAFLELKALWNATEGTCGWYMMGADGLRAKINRSIECEKVGYVELFSRYGDGYSRVTPTDENKLKEFELQQAIQVARANAPEGTNPESLARRSAGLRRLRTNIMKIRGDE